MSFGSLPRSQGDGRKGHRAGAPFDVIYVGGSMPMIPRDLVEQLAPGGRLLLCVGPPDQAQEQVLVVAGRTAGEGTREVAICSTMMHGLTD